MHGNDDCPIDGFRSICNGIDEAARSEKMVSALSNNEYLHRAHRMTEKTRPGPQRPKFPPPRPKFEPLPKRLFSQAKSMGSLRQRDLRIIRTNGKNNLRSESNGKERIALDPTFFEQTEKL